MSENKHTLSEQEIVERARKSVSELDLPDHVQRRLRLARSEAVEHVDDGAARNLKGNARWLVPAGLAASMALTVFLVSNNGSDAMPVFDEQEFAAASDMELLDDIEFLAWMLEEYDEGLPDDG